MNGSDGDLNIDGPSLSFATMLDTSAMIAVVAASDVRRKDRRVGMNRFRFHPTLAGNHGGKRYQAECFAAKKRNRFQSSSGRRHDRDVVPAKKRSHSHGDGTLLVIAVFKFVKGALLLTLAFGALSLLHKDVASEVEHWLDQLRIDPDNEFIGTLLSKLQLVHTKELKEMSALGAGYAALFLVEGTGLLFRKRWAEWLTIVATSSLMPLEVYELIKEFTVVRLLVVLVNAAVVLFLIYRVRQKEN
jgi:uncharacterized membrane protein (DUF2068 family)